MSALRIERIGGGARISGRLGFHEAAAAAPRWRELGDAGSAEIVTDVAALERVDSATLAVLLAWAAQLRREGSRLRLANVPRDLAALATLCGTGSLLGLAG